MLRRLPLVSEDQSAQFEFQVQELEGGVRAQGRTWSWMCVLYTWCNGKWVLCSVLQKSPPPCFF